MGLSNARCRRLGGCGSTGHIAPLRCAACGQSVAWLQRIDPMPAVVDRWLAETRQALAALQPCLDPD